MNVIRWFPAGLLLGYLVITAVFAGDPAPAVDIGDPWCYPATACEAK